MVVRLCLELAVTLLKWDLQSCVPSLDQRELSHLEKRHPFPLASLNRYRLSYFDTMKKLNMLPEPSPPPPRPLATRPYALAISIGGSMARDSLVSISLLQFAGIRSTLDLYQPPLSFSGTSDTLGGHQWLSTGATLWGLINGGF